MKIKSQLMLLAASCGLMMAAVGAVGLWGAEKNAQATNSVYEDRLLPLTQLTFIEEHMLRNEFELKMAADSGKAERIAHAVQTVEGNIAAITKTWEAYVATPLTPEEAVLAKRFAAARAAFVADGLKPTLAALKAGDLVKTRALVSETLPGLLAPAEETSAQLIALQKDVAKAEVAAALALEKKMFAGLAALVVVCLGSVLGYGLWLARRITQALGAEPDELRQVTEAVAGGDLSRAFELREGDSRSVLAGLEAMVRRLSQSVGSVRLNADQVSTAATEIAQGNQDLSGRTEQQAAALQQTASSMEELGSTVKQNADNARQASQLAMSASTVAVQGGDVVEQVVETMKGINESSKKIADIITVIDGIAFQTNILALNAAVEAARAGEQGRGFAVVAGEVRSLAQRSAEAAKEIKSLISTSVERVGQGSELVDRAGRTMEEVVASIKRVTDIMGEISSASAEQSAGVAQIGQAVTQMDQATQQNAALVEQSAAAAESLKQQAGQLVAAVSAFQLSASGGSSISAGLAPSPAAARPAPVRREASHASKAVRAKTAGAVRKPEAERAAPASAAAAVATASASGADEDWATF